MKFSLVIPRHNNNNHNTFTMAPSFGRRKLGAVERLGHTSAPAPQAALQTRNLNTARAPTRRGQFYEKAKSRHSREKRALEIHGAVSRDGAVALGGGPKKRQRRVLQSASLDEQFEAKGRERARNIALANQPKRSRNNHILGDNQQKKAARKNPPVSASRITAAANKRATKTAPDHRRSSFKENVAAKPSPPKRASISSHTAHSKAPAVPKSRSAAPPPKRYSSTKDEAATSSTTWDRLDSALEDGAAFKAWLQKRLVTAQEFNALEILERSALRSQFDNDRVGRRPTQQLKSHTSAPKQKKEEELEVIDLTDD